MSGRCAIAKLQEQIGITSHGGRSGRTVFVDLGGNGVFAKFLGTLGALLFADGKDNAGEIASFWCRGTRSSA